MTFIPAIPVLAHNNISIISIRIHTFIILDSPAAFFECLEIPKAGQGSVHHRPSFEAIGVGLLMQTVKQWDFVATCSFDKRMEVLDGVCLLHAVCNGSVQFALWMEEVVVRVNEDNCGCVSHFRPCGDVRFGCERKSIEEVKMI